jgi:glycerol kinase
MLFNINTLKWDDELLKLLNIPYCILPAVYPSGHIFGYTKKELFGREIPISGIAGDQHAALFGQTCFNVGDAKNTYGTGCFLLMNTGSKPISSANGLITTIGWGLDSEKDIVYALEGSVFVAGAAIQWLRDELGIIKTAHEADIEAEKITDNGGVYFVPAFTGLGAPYWDMYARGSITGLTRGSTKRHILRAALESIAYQSYDVLKVMCNESKINLKELKVDGGASRSDFLMQFQADLLEVLVDRPEITETTAQGAAFLAGLTLGIWQDKNELKNIRKTKDTFKNKMSGEERNKLLQGWNRAVSKELNK